MENRQFGKTDMQVSVLGFGGAEIGFEKATTDVVERVLGGALDAGLNVIDTAECYLESEELIGRAVRSRRDDFYLFTKCGHFEGSYKEDWRPESLIKSIERSLQRLKTDRLDLVQLHSCSEAELRKGDVIDALRSARDRGYTRYIGYSGDGQAARYAIDCGAFDSLQTSVSIADQEAIELTLPLARERQIAVIAKRPIGNAVWRYEQRPDNTYIQPYWDRLQQLAYDFLKGDSQQVGSTALRFTLSIPGVQTAIVGTSRPGRWLENARLLEAGSLPIEQFEAIRARWRQIADVTWVGLI
jgi:aryl-alcohol dehydrogenase-like predicted oxidoreductase